ncbi:hypothetical protein XarjCFBP7645_00825 [Xanthomonas arboricola]|uniref:Uncharacterized protein n=1 Tax=Xanthomonas arboricola TaxID=56448 RepID=A0A2S7AG68_9XANT|nr:hypothetical protein XarjCFBP7645_00825 [Xanthomonas arboricola]
MFEKLVRCPGFVAERADASLPEQDTVPVRTMPTDHPDRSLPAHRRGTLSGMDAAPEPTGTYLRRVPRWWAGKDPAAKPQILL